MFSPIINTTKSNLLEYEVKKHNALKLYVENQSRIVYILQNIS